MAIPEETLRSIQASIAEAEKQIPELEKDINDATRAGIDVKDQLEELRTLKSKVRQMKAVYGSADKPKRR